MGIQKIQHKSRPIINEINWDETNGDSTSFTAYVSGEIFEIESTNIAEFKIEGAIITPPFPVVKDRTYSVTIVKNDINKASSLRLIQRISEQRTIISNVPPSINDAFQSTKSYFIHPAESKVSIVDSSLLNESNFNSGSNWLVSPSKVIDLPLNPYCLWETAFFDHVHGNRMIIIGRDTNNTSNFYLCGIKINGADADTVWNLQENTQNALNVFSMDTNTSTIYPYINYLEDKVYLYSGRLYSASLSNLLAWSYISQDRSREYLLNRRKYEFSLKYNSFVGYPGIITVNNAQILDFYHPRASLYVSATAIDNVTGNIYIGTDSIASPVVWNNKMQIASGVGSIIRCRGICLSSKNRVGLVYPSSGSDYYNHKIKASLINLDSISTIRSEDVFNDSAVIGTADAEYIDCLGLFCVLANGSAGTQGRKLVYYINSIYDGVNSILKYKLLLDYEAFHVYTNRIRN